jgi:long-chain acyl-CoA synthetase
MISDPEVQTAVLKELSSHGLKRGLERFEIPEALTLIGESWTPESGVITAAFKLKRKVIQNLYQKDIDRMYA